jgi:TatD DNase family protein
LEDSGIVGNVHFFVGDTATAKRFLDLGYTLSFTGVVTFTHEYDDVIRYVPADRILIETDAPYVAPAPHRGKRNEPALVSEAYSTVADLRSVSVQELASVVSATLERVFGIRG